MWDLTKKFQILSRTWDSLHFMPEHPIQFLTFINTHIDDRIGLNNGRAWLWNSLLYSIIHVYVYDLFLLYEYRILKLMDF